MRLRGVFLSNRQNFEKPAIDIDAQIELLASRGLVIPDADKARHYLTFIGYYRLSGYFRYFYDPKQVNKFHSDATFDRVLELYVFDRKLRTLILDALERIEVAFKAAFCNPASVSCGPFWMCSQTNFDHGRHSEIMTIIDEAIAPTGNKHKHIFLAHFYKAYRDPYPPSWMLMETLSFGAASKIYKLAKGVHRIPVAHAFGVQHDVLESWLHALVFVRNVSAHHCRLWNRTFTITPKIPKKMYAEWPAESADKLYIVCSIIQHMMGVIADGSRWGERLTELIDDRPNVPLVAMGFPCEWKSHRPWG